MSEKIVANYTCDDVSSNNNKKKTNNRSSLVSVKRIVRAMSPIDDVLAVSKRIRKRIKTYNCNHCDHVFGNARKLAIHVRDTHAERDNVNLFKCENCGKEFRSENSLKLHMRIHSDDNPFKCTECGLNLTTKTSLKKHFARFHEKEEFARPYVCDHDNCGKSFISETELKTHKVRHSDEKNFMCEQCGKQFVVKANLIGHLRIHRGEKPYNCEVCGQCFTHPNSLIGHRRIHTGERPYICNFCGKGYRVKHQLSSHLIVHSDVRPFKCEICPKTFRSRSNLRVHKDEHQGIKRFSCSYCGRKFLVRGNMLKHVRRHIGERPHKCDTCGKAFIEKQELRNHIKSHQSSNIPKKSRKQKPKESSNDRILSMEEENVTPHVTPLVADNMGSLLPIVGTVNVSYFTPQHGTDLQSPDDHVSVILPHSAQQENHHMVYEEIPLENFAFTTFIRTPTNESYALDSGSLMSLRTHQYDENLHEQEKGSQIENAQQSELSLLTHHDPKPQSQGCRLCKQHFINIRSHLIEYHRIVIGEYENCDDLIF